MGSECGQEAIESTAVFLFETFHNKDHVGTEETRAIKQMFGPFPSTGAEASCASVAGLVASLGKSRVEDFIQSSHYNPQQGSTFGRTLVFSYDCYMLDPLEDLFCADIYEEKISLDLITFNNQQSGRKVPGKDDIFKSEDEAILQTEVEKYLNGGNMISSRPEDLCTSLFEMLSSQKSDDELQNEVRVNEHTLYFKF